MAQAFEARAFDSRLLRDDDDEEEQAYKPILDALIKQTLTPAQAAAEMDAWVVGDANARLQELKRRDPPFGLGEDESAHLVGPNPPRSVDMLMGTIAHVCSAFPAGHPAADAMVEFLRELRDMPKHDAPIGNYWDDDGRDGQYAYDRKYTLWPFGPDFVDWENFSLAHENTKWPHSSEWELGQEPQLRWSNFQHFIARATTGDLVDCSGQCALVFLIISDHIPDLDRRPVGGPNRIAGDLAGAAHWLGDDRARRWVFEKCQEAEGNKDDSKYPLKWNKLNWQAWKDRLAVIAGEERVADEVRALARSLRDKMEAEK